MNWENLLESVNDEVRLRNEYLFVENRILRNQIDGRVQLTDIERRELADIGAKLGKQALDGIATVAQADTILAWASNNLFIPDSPRLISGHAAPKV
jgi:putative transposase